MSVIIIIIKKRYQNMKGSTNGKEVSIRMSGNARFTWNDTMVMWK